MIKRYYCLFFFVLCTWLHASATDASALFDSLRQKILSVRDYTADVKMKINVRYMRIPQLSGTLYFKSPDKMRFERHGGLSVLPKKNNDLVLSNLIPSGNVTVIDAGETMIAGKRVRIIKVIPEDEQSDIVLTRIWVDEHLLLALKTETSTKTNGTVVMEMKYGRYINNGLPDDVTLTMDIKDFKVPKGFTMDYMESNEKKPDEDTNVKKGTIHINYLNYRINTGINDQVFSAPDK